MPIWCALTIHSSAKIVFTKSHLFFQQLKTQFLKGLCLNFTLMPTYICSKLAKCFRLIWYILRPTKYGLYLVSQNLLSTFVTLLLSPHFLTYGFEHIIYHTSFYFGFVSLFIDVDIGYSISKKQTTRTANTSRYQIPNNQVDIVNVIKTYSVFFPYFTHWSNSATSFPKFHVSVQLHYLDGLGVLIGV